MIVEENITVNIVTSNYKHYLNKGYSVRVGDKLNISVYDLSDGSQTKLLCRCDNCGSEKTMAYMTYLGNTKKLTENYYCNKCSYLKAKVTLKEKYGEDNPMKIQEFKDNYENNYLKNNGVKNPFLLKEVQDKIENTMISVYGVKHAMQSSDIKEKTKKTVQRVYNVDNVFQNETIKEKSKQTIKKIYNVEHISQSEVIKNKIKETSEERYGSSHVMKSKEFVKSLIDKNYSEKYKENKEYQFISKNDKIVSLLHTKCNNIFEINEKTINGRKIYNISLCTICYPLSISVSSKELELCNWIKSLNIDIIESDRKILNGLELDIYMPSHNLAIEFNGLYWHSENYKEKNYHLNKTVSCGKQDIHLLHIWEDEYCYKQEIVKSIISNRLGKIENKIYARKCEIKEVNDTKLVRKFLDDNHIQGYCQSNIKLGLFYENELVSLMTFGKRKLKKEMEFELIRFCNKLNTNIIGASSKLFKHFLKTSEHKEIVSYSDYRLFDGKMYEMLGFEKIHLSKPDYFWCNNMNRYHRFNFNKQKLVKQGYDASKTGDIIMKERGYYKLWSCGQIRWVYKKGS